MGYRILRDRKCLSCFLVLLVICAMCALIFPACGLVSVKKTARLTISLTSSPLAKNLLPDVDLNVASYSINGAGPGDTTFAATGITESSYTNPSLASGEWTIEASGANADGTVIVKSAATTVTLIAGETTTTVLSCLPIAGSGTFNLNMNWPSGIITTPLVVGKLILESGEAIALDCTVTGDTISCVKSDLVNGYYTLSIKLYDAGKDNFLAWSWNESVLIYKNQITNALWTLVASDLDVPDGGVSLTLTSDAKMPIAVTLSGGCDSLVAGDTMTVSAAGIPVPDSWQWYLDGDPLPGSEDENIEVGSGMIAGSMHSLVAVGKKGDKAGSAGLRFKVVATRFLTADDVPDPVLRAAFEAATGKTFEMITTYDLLALTIVDKADSGLTDLKGIEYCKYLETLRVPRNNITDISMLPKLKALRVLNLKVNPIIDFSPIGQMASLHAVRMTPTSLADISWLTPANLPNVGTIALTGHRGLTYSHALAQQLSIFAPLWALEMGISLTDANFIDLYDTVLYPHRDTLEWFESYNSWQISDAVTARLTNLTNLISLSISYTTSLTSLDFIKSMTSLCTVFFEGDGITDLSPLKVLYDAGGLREVDDISPSVDVDYLGLDLRTGTANREVVDYLLGKGIQVFWQDGNTTD